MTLRYERPVTLTGMVEEARSLWQTLEAGAVVWLTGDLGTGKTTFVKALAEAAGAGPARSPTFSLVHVYESEQGVIYHADCYRLNAPDEALGLDFPDMIRNAGVLLIEWPERAGAYAPAPDVEMKFKHTDDPSIRLLERVR